MFGGAGRRALTIPGSLRPAGPRTRSRRRLCLQSYRSLPGWGSRRARGLDPSLALGSVAWPRGAVLASDAMAGRTPLSKKEMEALRDGLLKERAELEHQHAELAASTFSSSQSDITGETSFDEEYADSGTATFERERDLSLENNIRDLIQKIDRALSRMDAGDYGLCERCRKPIEKARLKALPYAGTCIEHAQASRTRG